MAEDAPIELNFDIQFRNAPPIPLLLREGLTHYIIDHQPVGGFLTAVLQNNLHRGVVLADPISFLALPTIVCFIQNEAPRLCHGSPDRVKAWLAQEK